MQKRIWITWEHQRRNISMSRVLGATLYEFICDSSFWVRYPLLTLRTVRLILMSEADIIFAQNPSIVLAGLSVFMGKLLGKQVIIDAHNAGMFPLEGKNRWMNRLVGFINKKSNMVIVTNDYLKKYIEQTGGVAISIPDPIPDLSCPSKKSVVDNKFRIVYVCSWAKDEPFDKVIHVAAKLNESICVYVTGNNKGRYENMTSDSLVLTGFISDEDYEQLLCTCDAVMVLTDRENCLVCGAYEGVAVKKPLILSDTGILKDYFYKGCIYTENTEAEITNAIYSVIERYEKLSREVNELMAEKNITTSDKIIEFNKYINDF